MAVDKFQSYLSRYYINIRKGYDFPNFTEWRREWHMEPPICIELMDITVGSDTVIGALNKAELELGGNSLLPVHKFPGYAWDLTTAVLNGAQYRVGPRCVQYNDAFFKGDDVIQSLAALSESIAGKTQLSR